MTKAHKTDIQTKRQRFGHTDKQGATTLSRTTLRITTFSIIVNKM